jgi:hypothetical protein
MRHLARILTPFLLITSILPTRAEKIPMEYYAVPIVRLNMHTTTHSIDLTEYFRLVDEPGPRLSVRVTTDSTVENVLNSTGGDKIDFNLQYGNWNSTNKTMDLLAPRSVQMMIKLVEMGYYERTIFYDALNNETFQDALFGAYVATNNKYFPLRSNPAADFQALYNSDVLSILETKNAVTEGSLSFETESLRSFTGKEEHSYFYLNTPDCIVNLKDRTDLVVSVFAKLSSATYSTNLNILKRIIGASSEKNLSIIDMSTNDPKSVFSSFPLINYTTTDRDNYVLLEAKHFAGINAMSIEGAAEAKTGVEYKLNDVTDASISSSIFDVSLGTTNGVIPNGLLTVSINRKANYTGNPSFSEITRTLTVESNAKSISVTLTIALEDLITRYFSYDHSTYIEPYHFEIDWFGRVWELPNDPDYMWHENNGWMYIYPESYSGSLENVIPYWILYLYDYGLNAIFYVSHFKDTENFYYPYMWDYIKSRWVKYVGGSTPNRHFIIYDTDGDHHVYSDEAFRNYVPVE